MQIIGKKKLAVTFPAIVIEEIEYNCEIFGLH